MNLASIGGSAHGVVNDSIVQEIDVKTGPGDVGVARARAHPAARLLRADAARQPLPWDYAHVNSIDPGPRTVRRAALGPQHLGDLRRRHPHRRLHLADRRQVLELQARPGHALLLAARRRLAARRPRLGVRQRLGPAEEKQSRGLLLDPNTAAHTVTLVKQFTNPDATLLASSQGDLLSLPGGNWLMGYGGLPNFTEYDASGQVLLDATLGKSVQDFRTYLAPWSGQPTTAPAIAAQATAGG
jgi:hypothetical protein